MTLLNPLTDVYNVDNGYCIGAVSVKTLTQQNPGEYHVIRL